MSMNLKLTLEKIVILRNLKVFNIKTLSYPHFIHRMWKALCKVDRDFLLNFPLFT